MPRMTKLQEKLVACVSDLAERPGVGTAALKRAPGRQRFKISVHTLMGEHHAEGTLTELEGILGPLGDLAELEGMIAGARKKKTQPA